MKAYFLDTINPVQISSQSFSIYDHFVYMVLYLKYQNVLNQMYLTKVVEK